MPRRSTTFAPSSDARCSSFFFILIGISPVRPPDRPTDEGNPFPFSLLLCFSRLASGDICDNVGIGNRVQSAASYLYRDAFGEIGGKFRMSK